MPPVARAYVESVRTNPHRIAEADIEALQRQGLSEDEIFEYTVAAAVGAGLERLEAALGTLR